jgi:hypothetical protein
MKTYFFSVTLFVFCILSTNAQSTRIDIDIDIDEISSFVNEALKDLRISLNEIEFPEIEFSELEIEMKAALPAKEDMETIKDEMQSCINEIKKIDLSGMQEALKEMTDTLKDLDIDIRINNKSDHLQKHRKIDF